MEFLMDVQIAKISTRLDADRYTHTVVSSVFAPSLKYIQVAQGIRLVHIHETDRTGNLRSFFKLLYLYISQRFSERFKIPYTDSIRRKGLHFRSVDIHKVVDRMIIIVIFNYGLTGVRKLRQRFNHQESCHSVFCFGMIDVFR